MGRRLAADPSHGMDRAVPARRLQRHLRASRRGACQQRFDQLVVVDNRGGAGGTIGGMVAARTAPDGYTLLVVNPSLTFASIVYPDSGFDPMRDFAPVSSIATVPVALVVNPKLDVKPRLAIGGSTTGNLRIGVHGHILSLLSVRDVESGKVRASGELFGAD
jgi:hypothetical protein